MIKYHFCEAMSRVASGTSKACLVKLRDTKADGNISRSCVGRLRVLSGSLEMTMLTFFLRCAILDLRPRNKAVLPQRKIL